MSTFDFTKSALVLEGGGMRGVFTCGVLDWLTDRGVDFPYAVGVSAGACNGLSYLSRQRGRARFSNIDLLERHHYIGLRYLLTQGSILDQKLLYGLLPDRIWPFDYEAYFANPSRFEMVTTDCLTGRACYLDDRVSPTRLLAIVKASSSLPYVCPMTTVDGIQMLDGGIVDSIPVVRAMSLGYERCVVVLTRDRSFRKGGDLRVPRLIYRRYPRLREALCRRCRVYNEQLDLVDRLESEGRVITVRPSEPVRVSRMERDVKKLAALYDEGYRRAGEVIGSLL